MWERGGTTPHIINPAPLHTVPSDNILVTNRSVNLPSPPQHFISYQMEQVTLTEYIYWYPYLCGLLDFSITYPHSLALRGTLALYDCVVSLTLHLLYPWGKCRVPTEQEAGWATDLA